MRRQVAWVSFAAAGALALAGVAASLAWPGPRDVSSGFAMAVAIVACAFAAVGALIVTRTDGNAVGWLFIAFGLVFNASFFVNAVSVRAVAQSPHDLAARVAQWFYALLSGPTIVILLALLLFLYPTGAPSSKRWRRVVIGVVVISIMLVTLSAIVPGKMDAPDVRVVNPFGVDALRGILAPAIGVLFSALFLSLVAGAVSLVFRFRRGDATEREQIKWFASAGVFIAASFVAAPFYFWRPATPAWEWQTVFMIDVLLIPVTCGIAILRYRLYDIDKIVSRTVSYAIVSGLLAATFIVVVLVPTAAVGSRHAPEWLIAAGTLAVAALFRPVRRRVQDAVDHRFNRARYDAERTIEAFASRLRQETDIDALGSEITTVLRDTMQPAHSTLWLRDPTKR